MRRDPDGSLKVHRTPSNHANGMFIDGQDRLVIAETDGRIVRESPNGDIEVLAELYNGKPFNSPNDLAMDSKGRIYFTDPAYQKKIRKNAPQRDKNGQVVDGIYRIDAPGKVTRIITHEISMANGLIVSPKDQYLYLSENDNRSKGARKLWRFDLDKDGDIVKKTKTLIFDFGTDRAIDGMTIDSEGNIYGAAGLHNPLPNRTALVYKAGIYIIAPDGTLKHVIKMPMDSVTNVTFGGKDLKTLYITAGHSLWSYPMEIPGHDPFAGQRTLSH